MSVAWNSKQIISGIGLLAILALTSVRSMLEAGLVSHMLFQLPLLAFGGWQLGRAVHSSVPSAIEGWDQHGVTGFILAVSIAIFWMLPRSVEASLNDPLYELAKFTSIPLAGFALALSYPRASVLLRGLLLSHVISMFGVLAWSYLAAPVRLCLSYLAAEQLAAGYILLAVGSALSVYWGVQLLLFEPPGRPSSRGRSLGLHEKMWKASHEH